MFLGLIFGTQSSIPINVRLKKIDHNLLSNSSVECTI